MKNIVEIAKAYLADQPSHWLILSSELSKRVSAWAITQVESMEGATTEYEISDLLVQELLSPTLITIVAGNSNDRLAQEFITLTLTEWLKSAPILLPLQTTNWDNSILYKKEYLEDGDDGCGSLFYGLDY